MKKVLFLIIVILLLSGCKEDDKIYNDKSLLNELEKKYNDQFVILNKSGNKFPITYTFALENDRDVTFTLTYDTERSSEIGSLRNKIDYDEFDSYYMSNYNISYDEAYSEIKNYLVNTYKYEDNYFNINPIFYCKNGEHICGYSFFKLNYNDDSSCYISYDGNTINDDCKNFIK